MGEIDNFAKNNGGTIYNTEDWIKFKAFKPVILRVDNSIKGLFLNNGATPLVESTGYIDKIFDLAENEHKNVKFFINQQNRFFKEICLEAVGRGYEFTPFFSLVKNLITDEKEIWNGLDKKTRNCIRKAESNGIKIIEVRCTAENKKIYYEIHKNMSKRAGIKSPQIPYFDRLFDIKNKRMYFAYFNDIVIGGIIIIYFNEHAHIFKSASLSDYLKFRPVDLLWWTAIKECKKMGLKHLDFGGGMLKSYIDFKNGFMPEIIINIKFSRYKGMKSKPYKLLSLFSKAYKIKVLGD